MAADAGDGGSAPCAVSDVWIDGNPVNEADDIYDVDEDDGEGGDTDEEWDVAPVPAIFTTAGARRLFKVQQTLRAGGNYRPSFLFTGYVVEVEGEKKGSKAGGTERVVESGLTLSLRYEPPSPKFSRQCPHGTSYRLKVSRGQDFLYSTRGMHKELVYSTSLLVAVWGNLELKFTSMDGLSEFLEALKYVKVGEVADLGAALAARLLGAGGGQGALPAPPAGGAEEGAAGAGGGEAGVVERWGKWLSEPWVVQAAVVAGGALCIAGLIYLRR